MKWSGESKVDNTVAIVDPGSLRRAKLFMPLIFFVTVPAMSRTFQTCPDIWNFLKIFGDFSPWMDEHKKGWNINSRFDNNYNTEGLITKYFFFPNYGGKFVYFVSYFGIKKASFSGFFFVPSSHNEYLKWCEILRKVGCVRVYWEQIRYQLGFYDVLNLWEML